MAPVFPLSPRAFVASLWRHRDLVVQMTERDTRSRYRGSAGGIFWSVANPLLMLAVYLRDIGHIVPVIGGVLLFASPVFYPLDALAPPFREIVMLSPLTLPIVMAREVLLFGRLPDFADYAIYFAIAFSVAWLGFAWFQGTRKGFADVL